MFLENYINTSTSSNKCTIMTYFMDNEANLTVDVGAFFYKLDQSL
jgi:hypothetical protein